MNYLQKLYEFLMTEASIIPTEIINSGISYIKGHKTYTYEFNSKKDGKYKVDFMLFENEEVEFDNEIKKYNIINVSFSTSISNYDYREYNRKIGKANPYDILGKVLYICNMFIDSYPEYKYFIFSDFETEKFTTELYMTYLKLLNDFDIKIGKTKIITQKESKEAYFAIKK
jgi:hypothetical protein